MVNICLELVCAITKFVVSYLCFNFSLSVRGECEVLKYLIQNPSTPPPLPQKKVLQVEYFEFLEGFYSLVLSYCAGGIFS